MCSSDLIYMLPYKESDLGISGDLAGYMLQAMRANYAAIVPSGSFTDEALKHEYMHFLVHNRSAQQYPTWFDEGFAELLSTVQVTDSLLEYGKASDVRMSWLINGNWMSFTKLLNTRDTGQLRSDERGMFYAQAWFLMHFLNIGNGATNFGEQSRAYLNLVEAGTESSAAFSKTFAVDPNTLETKLRRYARRLKYYRGELITPFPAVATTIRTVQADEIAAELGTLSLLTGGAAAAEKYFAEALRINANNADALVGMGDVHKMTDRMASAPPYYQRALALEPDNANHHLDYGEYILDLARVEKSPEKVRALLVDARKHFFRSHALNANNPETLAMNGASYLFAGEDASKAVSSLEAAFHLLPAQSDIRKLLAQAYVATGRKDDARKQIKQLLAWSHSSGVPELEAMLSGLDASASAAADASATPSATPQSGLAEPGHQSSGP